MNNNHSTIDKMQTMKLYEMADAFRNLMETGNKMKLTADEVIS